MPFRQINCVNLFGCDTANNTESSIFAQYRFSGKYLSNISRNLRFWNWITEWHDTEIFFNFFAHLPNL